MYIHIRPSSGTTPGWWSLTSAASTADAGACERNIPPERETGWTNIGFEDTESGAGLQFPP